MNASLMFVGDPGCPAGWDNAEGRSLLKAKREQKDLGTTPRASLESTRKPAVELLEAAVRL
jgi:hypothetical protein